MKHLVLTFTVLSFFAIGVPLAYADHGDTPHSHEEAAVDNTEVTNPEQADITVNVLGMVCDFCAQAIEKVFMKREEVTGIDVNLDTFQVIIDLKPGEDIDNDTLTKLITDSGYTVNDIVRAKDGNKKDGNNG